MPPYRAQLGGINGSGVRMPDTRPIIDIGSVIDSASRAFANTREGVLHRALLQQAAQRADRDDAMKEEAHRMALISAGFRPATPEDQPSPDQSVPDDGTPAAPAPMRLGGTGPNADLVFGGTDLKTQRQMALRRNALDAASAAHPGMFSPAEVELATHDDHAYDQLIARRESILQNDQAAKDREESLRGATGPDGKPLSDATIRMLARSTVAYNKYLDAQINPPKDPIQIHASERQYDIDHPTTSKWVIQSTTNGLVQVNPETGETRQLTDKDGNPLQKPVAGGGAQAAKNKALVDLMIASLPDIERLAPTVRPYAITAAIRHPDLGNTLLTSDEQQFMAHARNWLAGVMHVESGARLSKEQWDIGLQRFFPTVGDTPATVQTKLEAMRRTTADRGREFEGGEANPPADTAPPSDNPFSSLIPKKK